MFPKRGRQTTSGPRDTYGWTASRDIFHIKIRLLMMIFNCIFMYFLLFTVFYFIKNWFPHSLCLKKAQLLTCSLYSAVLKLKNWHIIDRSVQFFSTFQRGRKGRFENCYWLICKRLYVFTTVTIIFYRCTVRLDNVKFFLPTNTLFINHIKC